VEDADNPNVRKLKGVGRTAVKHRCTHALYKYYLESSETQLVSYTKLASTFQQRMHTVRQTKRALSAFDSKRRFADDNIHTRAFGHYMDRIEQ